MSELITTRIKEAATRLHLANLEDNLGTLCERADELFREAADIRVAEFGERSLEAALSLNSDDIVNWNKARPDQ